MNREVIVSVTRDNLNIEILIFSLAQTPDELQGAIYGSFSSWKGWDSVNPKLYVYCSFYLFNFRDVEAGKNNTFPPRVT